MTAQREGFEIYDDRFAAMIPDDAKLVKHFTGMEWAEGPVYFAEGDYLLWSDIPNDPHAALLGRGRSFRCSGSPQATPTGTTATTKDGS